MAEKKKSSGANRQRTDNAKTTSSGRGRSQERKNSASGTSSRAKRKTEQNTAPRSKEREHIEPSLRDEILLAVTLLISILFILSYVNLCGKVGNVLNYIIFGMFGFFAYIFPFVFFFGVAFSLSNRGNRTARRKSLSVCTFLVCIGALLELANGYDPEVTWTQYFTLSAKNHNGGGIVGGTPVYLLCPLFDTVATTVILVVLMVICFMLVTGKELFAYIQSQLKQSYQERKESYEVREQRRLERALEEYEEYGELTDSYTEKRARVVRLQKNNAENITEETGKKPISFVDVLKQRGSAETVAANTETTYAAQDSEHISVSGEEKKERHFYNTIVDMQEIVTNAPKLSVPSEVSDIPIQGQNIEKDSHYEEELRRKFGKKETEVSVPVKSNPEKEQITETNTPNESDAAPSKPIQACDVPEKKGEEFEIEPTPVVLEKKYEFPPMDLLVAPPPGKSVNERELRETAMKLQSTFESFGVGVTVTNISRGPSVTQYELQPEQGVKVSQITKLSDDIKLNMAAADIRIEAPIPGKAAVGIEIPNKENSMVVLRELLESKEFQDKKSNLTFAVGKNISGQVVVSDIAKMPHMLIAGATGSGKSVCINTIVMSLLYKADPADVKLIMIDPKVVELSIYNGIPHLLIPVVTEPKKASAALNWAVTEMDDRYNKFAQLGVRDLKGYNERVEKEAKEGIADPNYPKMPQIVIIVDELADLMMVASQEVEDAICRLAQKARAAGLHLIIATQRPSVNVITGLIKANVPSRIAFAVASVVDSRTILDSGGAEKLLGKGDMLFFPSGYPKPVRIQGAFVSDAEVNAVVDFLKEQTDGMQYSEEMHEKITTAPSAVKNSQSGGNSDKDEYFEEAGRFVIEKQKASIGQFQRMYSIGFNRAARIMDQLFAAGVVGPEEGTKPRKILMTMEEFEQFLQS